MVRTLIRTALLFTKLRSALFCLKSNDIRFDLSLASSDFHPEIGNLLNTVYMSEMLVFSS